MDKQICLITGANSGIGKATARDFAQLGKHVILTCRDKVKGQKAYELLKNSIKNASIDLMILDLSSMESILNFIHEFKKKYHHLDILVHNAACFDFSIKKSTLNSDGFEIVVATNFLGPMLLTEGLLSTLRISNDARIITIGTKGLRYYPFTNLNPKDLNMAKTKYSIAKAYYNSKLALLIYTLHLSRTLKETDITVNAIEVPNVKLSTDRLTHLPKIYRLMYFIKKQFSISPEKMAQTYSFLAFSKSLQKQTGFYFDENQTRVNFPKKCYNETLSADLLSAAKKALSPWIERIPF